LSINATNLSSFTSMSTIDLATIEETSFFERGEKVALPVLRRAGILLAGDLPYHLPESLIRRPV
ncbi:hypothetical protein, partial [Klebsiella quasipneumoniae]|uniref:hypothetical protein n=1 Tax=Klebsiella quasipneumoniae TaxID=1463165 RepID=UPI0034D5A4F4